MPSQQEITAQLFDWNQGEPEALNQLMPMVEGELRRIARQYMSKEDTNHTLQTTALMNEAYLKLLDQRNVNWQNRAHFFALASQIMRRILLDHARTQARAKRGGGADHVDLSEVTVLTPKKSEELIALDDALSKLAAQDVLKARIVDMRYFGGLSVEETAEVLQLAPITVMRHWKLAKAWLRREIWV